jgi:hypothetical protein
MPLFRQADWRAYGGHFAGIHDGLLLPRARVLDIVLRQPPLALSLDQDHVAALLGAERQGSFAATIFGPPQDKQHNEDFALAAALIDRKGQDHAFVAVADGVSLKTFWPERASRISCFVALQVMNDYVSLEPSYSLEDIEMLRRVLSTRLKQALQSDHERLVIEGAVPIDWDRDSFEKHRGSELYWYNSTLLLALVGPNTAILLWSGDGSIHLAKQYFGAKTENTWPLRSTDDMSVSNVVSLAGPILFSGGRIEATKDMKSLTITLYSDGPDRTLQRNGDPFDLFANVTSSDRMAKVLKQLTTFKGREVDNYSAAAARWPVLQRRSVSATEIEALMWPSTSSIFLSTGKSSQENTETLKTTPETLAHGSCGTEHVESDNTSITPSHIKDSAAPQSKWRDSRGEPGSFLPNRWQGR